MCIDITAVRSLLFCGKPVMLKICCFHGWLLKDLVRTKYFYFYLALL